MGKEGKGKGCVMAFGGMDAAGNKPKVSGANYHSSPWKSTYGALEKREYCVLDGPTGTQDEHQKYHNVF